MSAYQPKAVLFDWDNTLVDTWPLIHKALHITFEEMGRTPWTLDEVRNRVGQSMRDSFPKLFGDQWEDAAALYRKSYKDNHLQNLEPLAGSEAVIRWLKDNNIQAGLVSNKMGDTLRKEVEHLGWEPYFDAVIGATDAEHDKPHPAPIYLALEHCKLSAHPDIWFIGDSEVDLEASRAAGLRAMLYGDATLDAEKENHFRGLPFDAHCRDHDELIRFLQAA